MSDYLIELGAAVLALLGVGATVWASIKVNRNADQQKRHQASLEHELGLTGQMQEWQKRLEERLARQDEQLETMGKTVREQTVRIDRLEDDLRDRDDIIADLIPVALWIRDGGSPPVPALTWRILQYLREHHPHTGSTPKAPTEGPSS